MGDLRGSFLEWELEPTDSMEGLGKWIDKWAERLMGSRTSDSSQSTEKFTVLPIVA